MEYKPISWPWRVTLYVKVTWPWKWLFLSPLVYMLAHSNFFVSILFTSEMSMEYKWMSSPWRVTLYVKVTWPWKWHATDHSKNQHQNRNKSFQCGSTNHLEQSSSQCQGRCHTRNISVTFEDTLFLVGIQHLVTWLRAHDLASAHLRRAINLCTYLLTYLLKYRHCEIRVSIATYIGMSTDSRNIEFIYFFIRCMYYSNLHNRQC